jgi:hypothetical protein
MIDRLRHLVRLLICLLPMGMAAQTSDFQVRTGVQLKQDLPDGFDVSLSYQLRLKNNAQEFLGSYLSADVGYKISDHLTALGEFRYATSYDWDKFRFGVGLQAKGKLGKLQWSAKARYQRERFLQSWPEIGQYPDRNNMRLKLELERKLIKHVQWHISSEPQVRIQGREGGFQRIRNIAGLDWEFVKRHHVDLSYYYQPEFKSTLDQTKHMLVATYSLELPKWWKGKKK